MPSIIEGYNYDIFISYRQKDNKGDRWVSTFVESLKSELEATFKEEISVYFDINPHDGLLETHDVDASLKEKLRCLIFIPIISRTYCDPRSFAWEHEFKIFIDQASRDRFGLKVKLPGGNVASRVLPVRIHDLNKTDISECETLLGGVLRGIEFIYKEAGIDKPLAPDDDDKKNINNTKFRIQLIKVAHAIKEIIEGMKAEPDMMVNVKDQSQQPVKEAREKEVRKELQKPVRSVRLRRWSVAAVFVLLIIAAVIVYCGIFSHDRLEKMRSSGERISVAVMPFQNMTNDTTWNVWQEGIQDVLINCLSESPEELKVRQASSINDLVQSEKIASHASITPSIARKISQKVDADILIYGSIKQAGSKIRLDAQLLSSGTQETLKAFEVEGAAREESIFQVTDSLKQLLRNHLIVSKMLEGIPHGLRFTGSTSEYPEAFRYYLYGSKAFTSEDYPTARDWYLKALSIDPDLVSAGIYIAVSYANQLMYEEGKKWCLKVYDEIENLPLNQKLMVKWLYALYFETLYEEIKYLKQSIELDDQRSLPYYILGLKYNELHQYDKAIPEFRHALDLHRKWGVLPVWGYYYTEFGRAYHKTGQYGKEKRLYRMAEKDFPDDILIMRSQAVLSLFLGKTKAADRYIEKYIAARKENSATEAAIATNLGGIYEDAGILSKAEEYYRQALELDSINPERMNNLSWFLIDNDRDINEGIMLIDKALSVTPDDSYMLDTKGWGLYKQGRYQEALDILEKAWSLKPVYDHELFLHLEAVKKLLPDKNKIDN